MIIFLSITTVLFFAFAYFFASELLKKFKFMQNFIEYSHEKVTWKYFGNKTPGMHNIVLQSDIPFCALVTFTLNIPIIGYTGVDYYGYLQSDKNNRVVFSTYLGTGSTDFMFLINNHTDENPVIVTSTEENQKETPSVEFKPHWYQKLGFYG